MLPGESLFPPPALETVAREVTLLRGFADTAALRREIDSVAVAAPFRHLETRAGVMSVAMTNCGRWGWHSDARGYRYLEHDPQTARPWPALPEPFLRLAAAAAERAGFSGFEPDCCLINRYLPGARMGTHRDFDERDLGQPIVSVSIGLPATFLWYGARRSGTPRRVSLGDGDVLVWGRGARAGYHAVQRVMAAGGARRPDENTDVRYNLTFRRAR